MLFNRYLHSALLIPLIYWAEMVMVALAELLELINTQHHCLLISSADLVDIAFQKDTGHSPPPLVEAVNLFLSAGAPRLSDLMRNECGKVAFLLLPLIHKIPALPVKVKIKII